MQEKDRATREDICKLASNLPMVNDMILQLLKGHLIIEEILRELLQLRLQNPEALRGKHGASFDCHQVICLVESLHCTEKERQWVWVASKKLNRIRNSLAHNLQPNGLNEQAIGFISFVTKSSPHFTEIKKGSELPLHTQIFMSITVLTTALSSLKKLNCDRKV